MGRVAIVLATLAIATAAAWLFAPVIGRAVFPLIYAAVAIAAGVAGIRAGVFAVFVGLFIIEFVAIPRSRIGGVRQPHESFSLAMFVVVSALVIVAVNAMRRARRRVRNARAEMERANADLERTNIELERALDEATASNAAAIERAERLRLLDEASRILASSLDYETTIAATARLLVPAFADWSSVDVLVDGDIEQLGTAHLDTAEFKRMSELRGRTKLSRTASTGLATVLRTGEPQFMARVNDEFLVNQARSAEHLEALRALGVRSAIIVPMIARGQIIGALTLVRIRRGAPFDDGSLALARDIAARAALAIDNAQLYRKAVVANESKSNFLATMSHELRTPLTAIIGYEELLSDGIAGPVTDEQRQHLGRVKASARQLLTLIDEILLYARIEAGVESIRITTVRAKTLVDEAITVVAPMASARDLPLVAGEIGPELTLETDHGKVRQMLVNLLANAVKFTERGRVTVRAYAREADVVFEVQDTGIGITPEDVDRIFEAFWQVEQSKTRRAGGSGLGLSTSRQLARMLGGDVSVESQYGVGSTFRIVLPRHRRETAGDRERLESPA